MSTLLLRLAAPLQAWGSSSRFNRRTTEREPTKSGVIGLVAAALGRRRTDSIQDLQGLRFGVRVDQPGRLVVDFHTAHTTDWTQSFVSHRHYLADAVFVVGLAADDDDVLTRIDDAVQNPVFPLYLGRRSCPPEGRVSLGIRQGVSLGDALRSEDWQASPWYQRRAEEQIALEIISDAEGFAEGIGAGAYQVRDLPLDFAQTHRRYAFRTVSRQFEGAPLENPYPRERAANHLKHLAGASTKHDPLETEPEAIEPEAKEVH